MGNERCRLCYTCNYSWCILKKWTVHYTKFYWPCASLNQIEIKETNYSTVLNDSENKLSSQFVWNQYMIHQAQSAWIENYDDLVTCFQSTLCETQSNMDESLDLLTLCVTDIMRPFLKLTKGLRNQFITQVDQDPIHVWCHRANLALMKILVKKKPQDISISTHPFW